jgi:hypothetical protein
MNGSEGRKLPDEICPILQKFVHHGEVRCCSYSRTGKHLAVGDSSGVVTIFEIEPAMATNTQPLEPRPDAYENKRKNAATDENSYVHPPPSYNPVLYLRHGGGVLCLSFSGVSNIGTHTGLSQRHLGGFVADGFGALGGTLEAGVSILGRGARVVLGVVGLSNLGSQVEATLEDVAGGISAGIGGLGEIVSDGVDAAGRGIGKVGGIVSGGVDAAGRGIGKVARQMGVRDLSNEHAAGRTGKVAKQMGVREGSTEDPVMFRKSTRSPSALAAQEDDSGISEHLAVGDASGILTIYRCSFGHSDGGVGGEIVGDGSGHVNRRGSVHLRRGSATNGDSAKPANRAIRRRKTENKAVYEQVLVKAHGQAGPVKCLGYNRAGTLLAVGTDTHLTVLQRSGGTMPLAHPNSLTKQQSQRRFSSQQRRGSSQGHDARSKPEYGTSHGYRNGNYLHGYEEIAVRTGDIFCCSSSSTFQHLAIGMTGKLRVT